MDCRIKKLINQLVSEVTLYEFSANQRGDGPRELKDAVDKGGGLASDLHNQISAVLGSVQACR